MPILEANDICQDYTQATTVVHALRHTTLAFEQGEFTAIVGASGSGKSTLMHILAGLQFPTDGDVLLEGQSVYALGDRDLSRLRRQRFGFIFQAYNLMPELTALENILLPLRLDGRAPTPAYLNELIDILGLRERLDHVPGALSGGQQQRVAIARALIAQPAIVFADEPTGNLDSQTSREVMALLHALQKRYNQTLIMVTHDLDIALTARRAIRIDGGEIVSNELRGAK